MISRNETRTDEFADFCEGVRRICQVDLSHIPELAEDGRLRCWSAGSSYGAEAYTLATVAP